ncbi:extracellular solute-binding protein [Paenibacillus sp. JCM 10914]|uniref:ABC transporter substrate-binding protein n=1 Tax=Paenibacillus sp. JCM 10914 TaxID=1236974 RepID=UPI0003CC7C46|nr:ABC transporter substrate-binding protein [Paenibacillus sp. JCM 10914]GAE05440.1 ABC transporter, substrate-binding protein [Paenibacillus sp. JCM 10914]
MKIRRFMGIVITIIMLTTGILSGCSKGDNNTSETKNEDPQYAVSPAGQLPITDEKTTIRIMVPDNAVVEDFATNEFTKYLEEQTNIHIDWDVIPSSSAAEKLNLVLSSGDDLPDVIMGFGMSNSQQMIFGSQGIILPLNDLMEQYGFETKKMFEKLPIVKESITAPDGNIYSLPHTNECFHCTLPRRMWIYQPWLDELGLTMPTTTDEFYQVLKAFKENDPNGNGKADEIPLSGSPTGFYTGIDSFIMNAFIYNPGGDRVYLENDQVVVPYGKPEWREGLRYLNMLYKEKLLDPQSLTQDGDQLKRLGENPDTAILGSTAAMHMGVFSEFYGASNRWLEYKTIPPLKGPNGVQVAPREAYHLVGSGEYLIMKSSKHSEAAFRLADYLYNEEVTLRSTIGRPGIEWTEAEADELGINGQPAKWKQVMDWGTVQNVNWGQTGPSLRTNELRLGEVANSEKPLEVIMYDEAKNNYEPYQQNLENVLPPLFFSNDQAIEIADLSKTINDYVEEMIARFTTGDANLDTEWDSYIDNLKKMNVDQYLSIYQEAYDSKYKK